MKRQVFSYLSKINVRFFSREIKVDFGRIFAPLVNKAVPLRKRIKKSLPSWRIFAYESQKINNALLDITKLANLPGEVYKNAEKRYSYQKLLSTVYRPIVKETSRKNLLKKAILILERGALLTSGFYDLPPENIIRVRAKRENYGGGHFGLKLSKWRFFPKLKKLKELLITEDCVATGDSIAGTLLVLKKKGFNFKKVKIHAAVASQKGIEFLQKFLPTLGVKKLTVKCGSVCFLLDKDFYLRRTIEEGFLKKEYFVGDMGQWSIKLPEGFNKKAWWNTKRIDNYERFQKQHKRQIRVC